MTSPAPTSTPTPAAASGIRGSTFVTTSDDTRLYVWDSGRPGRPVLLTHAWGLSSHMWTGLIAGLESAGLRPIVYDRRGSGRSNTSTGGYDLDTLASDLVTVADSLDRRDLALVGYSLGGLEAVRAAAGPLRDRVVSLVLAASMTPRLQERPDNPHGVPSELFVATRRQMADDLGGWIEAGTAGFWGQGVGEFPVDTAWVQQSIYSTPLHALLAANEAGTNADVRADVASISCPTLVIHGDADRSTPIEITALPTAALLRHGTLRVIEGAGHGMYRSFASTFNDAVIDFVRAG